MSKIEFENNGYVVVPDFVDSGLRGIATQYALMQEAGRPNMDLINGEGNVLVHQNYGDTLMDMFLAFLQPKVEQVSGLQLYPTYSYFRVYRNGSTLPLHEDRPSCQISVSVNFGQMDVEDWPIYMHNQPLSLEPGGGVIYKGMEVPHFRDALTASKKTGYVVQGFFHYVDVTAPFAQLVKYDARPGLGYPSATRNQNKVDRAMNMAIEMGLAKGN